MHDFLKRGLKSTKRNKIALANLYVSKFLIAVYCLRVKVYGVKVVVLSLIVATLCSCGGGGSEDKNSRSTPTPSPSPSPIPTPYTVRGIVTGPVGNGLANIEVYYNQSDLVLTDENGEWQIANLSGSNTIFPDDKSYSFSPATYRVNQELNNILFEATQVAFGNETLIINWFNNQQLPNGLLESTENGNVVSLYDNALAAMVFMLYDELERAESIFNFFNSRMESELLSDVGGFSQFRDRDGVPSNHRWMGDNAWLLVALNNYKEITGSSRYDILSAGISSWLRNLQDTDGGLFAGYDADNALLNYKVTEGNIDAFSAVVGYDNFHGDLLNFLGNNRWDDADNNLMAWPDNQDYRYAIDNQTWAFCVFVGYPHSAIYSADRFASSQIATVNGIRLSGFDIDEDKDTVFIEGTGQMALTLRLIGEEVESNYYMAELEKVLIASPSYDNASGFPYASNIGTGFGDTPLWTGADTEIAISGGAWYLFAKNNFNPFAVGRNKEIPLVDIFWPN
jgi:hypothetical protein